MKKEPKPRTAGKPPSSSTQAFSTAICSWVPVALPGAHPGAGVAVIPEASQGHPKGWEPGLPAPRKLHGPPTLEPIQCPALLSVTPPAAALPCHGTQPQLRGAVQSQGQRDPGTGTAGIPTEEAEGRGGEPKSKQAEPVCC